MRYVTPFDELSTLDDAYPAVLLDPRRWNGWERPWFTDDVVARMARDQAVRLASDPDDADLLRRTPDGGWEQQGADTGEWFPLTCWELGGMKLFQAGDGWTWRDCTPDVARENARILGSMTASAEIGVDKLEPSRKTAAWNHYNLAARVSEIIGVDARPIPDLTEWWDEGYFTDVWPLHMIDWKE